MNINIEQLLVFFFFFYGQFDEATRRFEQHRCYELAYARRKLRYLYANGAEEHRVGRPGEGAGGFRKRRAGGIHGAAAEQAVLDLEGQTVPAQGVEHAQGLLHDFGTDAVTRQNKNLHGVVRIKR